MKVLVLATGIAAALVAGGAQAATYVVQAKALAFDQALAQKMEANGGQVVRRFPQIGVAIVEADDGVRQPRRARAGHPFGRTRRQSAQQRR